MTVTEEGLKRADDHWAVQSIPEMVRRQIWRDVEHRLVFGALGNVLRDTAHPSDPTDLNRLASAYEIAAIDGVDALLFPGRDPEAEGLAEAAAYRAYSVLRVAPIPSEPHQKVAHVLRICSFAYGGDEWPDARGWLRDHWEECQLPSPPDEATSWDQQLLFVIYDCWLRLFRKAGWEDLESIAGTIGRLRDQQQEHEPALLADEEANTRQSALYLAGLYHWARATEMLSTFILQGEPNAVESEVDRHLELAREAAFQSHDITFDVLIRWLHIAARRMITSSIWSAVAGVGSDVHRFAASAVRRNGLFELLPPQRAALREGGLLDAASQAIVVELPTSGGKTALAEFRIVQALNQFSDDNGWVAYVAPTRALVSQIARRLRRDFQPLGLQVDQLTAAVEVDPFESRLLSDSDSATSFHILVCTPEKLDILLRSSSLERPLALVVLDEAHNIEDEDRGLRIELLLATIKTDESQAGFLLLLPNVPNPRDLARWLAPQSGRTIVLGATVWKPNERLVGTIQANREGARGDWALQYKVVATTPRTAELTGETLQLGGVRPLPVAYSAASATKLAAAAARVMSSRGTSIAIGRTLADTWAMARNVASTLRPLDPLPDEVALVQRFLQDEVSPDFELVNLLSFGVGVHHAGLPDEARSLIEWLTEEGKLRVLCATTTIAQGINFPVSSIFLSSRFHAGIGGHEMSYRDFWNLCGRAGRIGQEILGIVGVAAQEGDPAPAEFIRRSSGDVASRLLEMVDELLALAREFRLNAVRNDEAWSAFRSYVAHMWAESQDPKSIIQNTESVLRNTLGYSSMQAEGGQRNAERTQALIDVTREYVGHLANSPATAVLADATGFDPTGVQRALGGLRQLTYLDKDAWSADTLFGPSSVLNDLVGVMMRVPQIRNSMKELGGDGLDETRIADVAKAWVRGDSLEQIARRFFEGSDDNLTDSLGDACRSLYRALAAPGAWGLAALSKLPSSGLDFDRLSDEEREAINSLPALIYHGVSTEEAVLMRMNAVPRRIAQQLGEMYVSAISDARARRSPTQARNFIAALAAADWERAVRAGSAMSGADYQTVWRRLSGVA